MKPSVRLPHRDATADPPAALRPLFEALAARTGAIPIAELEDLLRQVPVTADQLGDAIAIDAGAYVRTLVFDRDNVEVLVMAWLPGQRSPIHDHAGSACAVRVVSGSAHERLYNLRDDGLAVEYGNRTLTAGGVMSAFDTEIHSLGNGAPVPASMRDVLVTIHVYSPPLAPTRKYTEATAAR